MSSPRQPSGRQLLSLTKDRHSHVKGQHLVLRDLTPGTAIRTPPSKQHRRLRDPFVCVRVIRCPLPGPLSRRHLAGAAATLAPPRMLGRGQHKEIYNTSLCDVV